MNEIKMNEIFLNGRHNTFEICFLKEPQFVIPNSLRCKMSIIITNTDNVNEHKEKEIHKIDKLCNT
jgi:hypothetical protein